MLKKLLTMWVEWLKRKQEKKTRGKNNRDPLYLSFIYITESNKNVWAEGGTSLSPFMIRT